ncbi:MAG: MlaD family protein [Planctomycetota bacterium]
MNEPYRLRYTNQIVGAFVLVVLLITTIVSVVLFSRLFVTQDFFYVLVTEEEATDLRTGTEIVVLGQTIGQIESLRYMPDTDLVRVKMGVDSEFKDQISTNSEVTLNRKFGVGTPILTIRRKASEERIEEPKPLEPGDFISRFRGDVDPVEKMAKEFEAASTSIDLAARKLKGSLNDSVDPAVAQGQAAFESVERTSETLRPEGVETLEQFRATTVALENRLTELASRVDQLIDRDVRRTVGEIEQSAIAATRAADSVSAAANSLKSEGQVTSQEIAKTLATLRETAEKIQQLTQETRQVVQIVRGEAEELPGTTARVNDTVTDTQELVGDIRDHWLLRGARDDRQRTRQIPPSSVRGGSVR